MEVTVRKQRHVPPLNLARWTKLLISAFLSPHSISTQASECHAWEMKNSHSECCTFYRFFECFRYIHFAVAGHYAHTFSQKRWRQHPYLDILTSKVSDLRSENTGCIHRANRNRVPLDDVVVHADTVIILWTEKHNIWTTPQSMGIYLRYFKFWENKDSTATGQCVCVSSRFLWIDQK